MTVILAKLYPQAEVIGIDIAPVPQNRHGQTPSNVTYVQGDVRELIKSKDSKFQPGSFDYIFERLLILGITDWPGHISAISSLLKPSGWLECHEFAWRIYAASGAPLLQDKEAFKAVEAGGKEIGLNLQIGSELADTFRSTGNFGEVKEVVYGCSPKERADRPELIGLERQILGLFQLMIRKMCGGRRSEEDIERFQREIAETWEKELDGSERYRMFVVTGQKK